MEQLLEVHSNVGDVVCDLFMGSGTTGVACCNLSRSFIGIELSEEYFKIAEQRIQSAYNK
jgi:site-specific DNA-methyltransferase (adenine-specific)